MVTLEEIETKLKKLREEYVNPATSISRQETLTLMGRALNIAKDKVLKGQRQLKI